MDVTTEKQNTKAIKRPLHFDVDEILKEISTISFDHYSASISLCANKRKLYKLDLISPEISDSDENKINFYFREH